MENLVLGRGEVNRVPAALHFTADGVDSERSYLEARILLLESATNQRVYPCTELVEVEGLDEVVVRAHLEPADPVLHMVLGGEDEYMHLEALANLLQDIEAAHSRQEHVQNHNVVFVGTNKRKPFHTVGGKVHGEVGLAQPMSKRTPEAFGILDDENLHEHPPPCPHSGVQSEAVSSPPSRDPWW